MAIPALVVAANDVTLIDRINSCGGVAYAAMGIAKGNETSTLIEGNNVNGGITKFWDST